MVEQLKELKAGKAIRCPVYSYADHQRTNETELIQPSKVVIVEGILIFQDPRLREMLDIKIFVETDADVRILRRALRDVREKGFDTEFGRKFLAGNLGALREISTPPFYILPSTAVLLATYCGVKIDGKMQVIDVFGNVIQGLWASGEVAGGFHGRTYLSATAFISAVVLGWVAADSVVKA